MTYSSIHSKDKNEELVPNTLSDKSKDGTSAQEARLVAKRCISTDQNQNTISSKFKVFCSAIGRQRNLFAFWVFGLATNFPFIISLSAAQDILSGHSHHSINNSISNTTNHSIVAVHQVNIGCKFSGTGVVLLSAILPDLLVKITVGLTPNVFSYAVKTVLITGFTMASFLILALVKMMEIKFLGVIFASIACGLGEVTFMSLSCFYFKDVVSTWSSGTGTAGILGAIMYAGLTSLGVSARTCLLSFLVFPIMLFITYFFILMPYDKTEVFDQMVSSSDSNDSEKISDEKNSDEESQLKQKLSLTEKFYHARSVVKYIIPLLIVYFSVYIIIQGVVELLYFKNVFLTFAEQYRWYQASYRIGVFISRSSVKLFRFNRIYLFPIIPTATIVLFITEIYFRYIPSFWIVFALVFFVGFLQGISYVNTFYLITTEEYGPMKEIGLGLATASRPLGIIIAGLVSIPLHDLICRTAPNMS